MGTTIGWGIVGCGDVVARKAGAAFGQVAGSRLVAVMRRDREKVEAAARQLGAELATTDAKEVIHHPEIDVVYVATPPAHHLEYAEAIAAAGKAALIEKPPGRSLEETERMHAAFRAARKPLFVSYYRPHLPRFAKVRELIETGAIGDVVAFDYRMAKPPKGRGWTLDPERSGGGPFYGIGCHMLDLFDGWFGPLEVRGAAPENVLPCNVTEDVVTLSLATASGVVGSASWNFAASRSRDELVIDGTLGRIVMKGTSTDAPVRVEHKRGTRVRMARSPWERNVALARDRLKLRDHETFRFGKVEQPHRPLVEHIVASLRAGEPRGNADAALRTARVTEASLAPLYGPRTGDFWNRTATWNTRQARATRRIREDRNPDYELSDAELAHFAEQGFVGPFRCDADWRVLIPMVPIKKGRNLHLTEPNVFDVCTHPSIVRRVAQVSGEAKLSFFKSRFVVKTPRQGREVGWHQDVGYGNGGFFENGQPVPTWAMWMAIDRSDAIHMAQVGTGWPFSKKPPFP